MNQKINISQQTIGQTVIPDSVKSKLDLFMELSKFRITFFVAISTFVGAFIYEGSVSFTILFATLGVFLLACGSSALNHYQEKHLDIKMDRTKNRPIPSGRISANNALLFSFGMILTGSVLLVSSAGVLTLALGMLSLLWYNVLYTPMKRKFALAVVPGAVIGAIPPIIGYVAAGGSMFSPEIVLFSLFFFIWQIPHFWLLLLIYDKDYKSAGFPTLTDIFSTSQIKNITFIWIGALGLGSIALTNFANSAILTFVILFALSLWLIYTSSGILKSDSKKVYRKAFMNVNIYVLVVVLLLSIDRIFN